jgi:hypothetical protein
VPRCAFSEGFLRQGGRNCPVDGAPARNAGRHPPPGPDNGLSRGAIRDALETMARKGAVLCVSRRGQDHFALVPFVVGMFEFQAGSLSAETYRDTLTYFKRGFALEYLSTALPQTRVVPIRKASAAAMRWPPMTRSAAWWSAPGAGWPGAVHLPQGKGPGGIPVPQDRPARDLPGPEGYVRPWPPAWAGQGHFHGPGIGAFGPQ